MSRPSIPELRSVSQPEGLLDRRSGEHWAGRIYMRRISVYVTRALAGTPVTPNALTLAMLGCGLAAGAALVIPGLTGAVLSALLVQAYLLLDCSDGELARWRSQTSPTGVYLDRVGHYLAEAALLVGAGFRAGGGHPDGWAVLGCLAALGAVLIKAETDLVHVARAQSGLPQVTEAHVVPRSSGVARMRTAAAALRFHRIIGAVEASLILLAAAVLDAVLGGADGLTATRAVVVAFAVVAAVQAVLHLVSVLMSSRLR
jgi:phosphatidylglycerophosphate synthase